MKGIASLGLTALVSSLLIVAAVPVFRVVRTQTLPAPSVDNVHFPAGLSGHLPAPVGGEFPPDALKSTSA